MRFKIITFTILFSALLFAQPTENLNTSEIKLAIEKLNVLGSVLYIAAHPDDENTAALTYFSKGKLLRTGYLALTRGDGGQNLIGDEQGDFLGVIRTNELLQARKIDGAEQFFTRAIDFGYSKTVDETLTKWDREKILSDVIWVIRKFKPDIIITRFPTTGEGRHGQHTVSAILALEAFNIANDPDIFPEQLKFVDPWQPKRIYWNAWPPALNSMGIDADTLPKINFGEYNPLLGRSYTEISAKSRTMHKSQGFGDDAWRANYFNHFLMIGGGRNPKNIFDNVDLTWNRVEGGEKFSDLITKILNEYDFEDPSKSIPDLIKAEKELNNVTDEYWREQKRREVIHIIQACAGIWVEAIAEDYLITRNEDLNITAAIINRSNITVKLKNVTLDFQTIDSVFSADLQQGELVSINRTMHLPDDAAYTHPFWLDEAHSEEMYVINNQTLIGNPVLDSPLKADFMVEIDGEEIVLSTPVYYRTTDPVKGEIYRNMEVAPQITANLEKSLMIFSSDQTKNINVSIKNNGGNKSGKLGLNIDKNWKVKPEYFEFSFTKKNEEQHFMFSISPPPFATESDLIAEIIINNKSLNRSLVSIDYSHIPVQTMFPLAKAKCLRLDTGENAAKNIGYITGSGDKIPDYLKELGFEVTTLTDEELTNGSLNKYDAIIAGIRAYNTNERMQIYEEKLKDYVFNGGTYIVQYNTTGNLLYNPGMYPLKISRNRVTEEDSPVTILFPDHKLFNYPNKINNEDFNGWVQERGLYFPDEWDQKYIAMLEMNDTNEAETKGSLLYSEYGKGVYIYTGISFFRQIPAGVAGAYRLFLNIISAGNNEQ